LALADIVESVCGAQCVEALIIGGG